MPNIGNATHAEIAFALSHFYPGMIFNLSGVTYEGLVVLPSSPVPKPPLQELIDHIPEARTLIIARRAYLNKIDTFQRTYPVQDQLANLIAAIYDPTTTSIVTLKSNPTMTAMKNLWNSL